MTVPVSNTLWGLSLLQVRPVILRWCRASRGPVVCVLARGTSGPSSGGGLGLGGVGVVFSAAP